MVELREEQKPVFEGALRVLENKESVIISMPQGTGKSFIALSLIENLLKNKKIKRFLILTPSRQICEQWKRDYCPQFDLGNVHYITPSHYGTKKLYASYWKDNRLNGIISTVQLFQSQEKSNNAKLEFFDILIVDEVEFIIKKDFLRKYNISKYFIEKLIQKLCIGLVPYDVDQEKLNLIGKELNGEVIRKAVKTPDTDIKHFLVEDNFVKVVLPILREKRHKYQTNIVSLLKKYKIKHIKNFFSLISKENLKDIDNFLSDKISKKDRERFIKKLELEASNYNLTTHLIELFLYENKEKLRISVLCGHPEGNLWLNETGKKFIKIKELVESRIKNDKKIFIFVKFKTVAGALAEYLKNLSPLLITGDLKEYSGLINEFKEGKKKILIATPSLSKGTNLPEADTIIIMTPYLDIYSLKQVIGRIRGGEAILLSFKSTFEEEKVSDISTKLRERK